MSNDPCYEVYWKENSTYICSVSTTPTQAMNVFIQKKMLGYPVIFCYKGYGTYALFSKKPYLRANNQGVYSRSIWHRKPLEKDRQEHAVMLLEKDVS